MSKQNKELHIDTWEYHNTFDNETFIYSQNNTNAAIELLQLKPDFSIVNQHSRQRAKKYLSGLKDKLIIFKNKRPDSNVAHNIQKMIDFYSEMERIN